MVVVCGVVPAVVLLAGVGCRPAALNPSTDPLAWPSLPVVPALAILVCCRGRGGRAPPPARPAPSGSEAHRGDLGRSGDDVCRTGSAPAGARPVELPA